MSYVDYYMGVGEIWPKSTTHKKTDPSLRGGWRGGLRWPIKSTYNLWTAPCGILEEFSCGIHKQIIIEIPDPDPVSRVERDILETKLSSIIRYEDLQKGHL